MVPTLTPTEIRKLAKHFSKSYIDGIDGTARPRYYPVLGEQRTHVYHGDAATDRACEKLNVITHWPGHRTGTAEVVDKNGKVHRIRWETTAVDQLWNIRIYVG